MARLKDMMLNSEIVQQTEDNAKIASSLQVRKKLHLIKPSKGANGCIIVWVPCGNGRFLRLLLFNALQFLLKIFAICYEQFLLLRNSKVKHINHLLVLSAILKGNP